MLDFTLFQPKLNQKILIGCDFYLSEVKKFVKDSKYKSVFIVYDEILKKEAIKIMKTISNRRLFLYGINADQEKSAKQVISTIKRMQISGCLRNTLLIALGGGSIGDIVGVVASIYMRGIDYIQIGTTPMSQFDAIVQKVAVNVNHFKNVIGAFHSPILTICDTKFIQKDSTFFNAFSEVIKHKIIQKSSFKQLKKFECQKIQNTDFSRLIYNSLKVKLSCVVKDPFDKLGIQKKLSLGHTIANIIETKVHITHGKAVWIGLLVAIKLSLLLAPNSNYLNQVNEFLYNFIDKYQVKLPIINLTKKNILNLLKKDKISMDNGLSMVIITEKNEISVKNDLHFDAIIKAMEQTSYIQIRK